MNTTLSRDGTTIAYEKSGSGPPLVLVDGAFCHRSFGPMPQLAPMLAESFTVIHYDRRGRGGSGDTSPYAVAREIEDIRALFEVVGGSAFLYGTSSGAVLALRAAASGLDVKRLALHEPPLALDDTHQRSPADFREQVGAMLASGRRGDAVKLFMKVVGVPGFAIAMMRLLPGPWPKLKAVAHTLPYDFAVLGDTQSGRAMPRELGDQIARIRVPTLMLVGGKSPRWLHHAAQTVANAIPGGAALTLLPGEDHNVSARSMGPALRAFFAS